MTRRIASVLHRCAALALAALAWCALVAGGEDPPPPAWPQWGGPQRNFSAPAGPLASSWPAEGPRRLWSRELGAGYSAILADGGRLYTMYRAGDKEAVVCLDAETGRTIWERRYAHGPAEGHVREFGEGPNSTPLIAGELLFTIGVAGEMHAFDKGDGKVIWSHDLWSEEFGGERLPHGYGSSPLAHGGTVIVPIGGDRGALVAFDQKSGEVRWRTQHFRNSYSSPRLVDLGGERQLLLFTAEEVLGLNPDNGALRWSYPHANPWGHNITMPAVAGDTVFLSSPQAGARGLRLTRHSETIEVEEVWSARKIQLYHTTPVQDGDWVYASSGTMAPAFMMAVNIRTGQIGWRERGLAKANCVEADGKLVILDENGVLYLARATPEKFVVQSRTQLLEHAAWTVPTIVGRTLYARDTRRILAVDLGR